MTTTYLHNEITEQTQNTDAQDAVVLPFSRTLLGEGARVTEGARILGKRDSPVYLPGDPRLKDRQPQRGH